MNFRILVLPGDGVGPEVTAEAVKVMEAVGRRFGHAFDLSTGSVGGAAIDELGTALPDETMARCQDTDAVLFGAVGGPKWDDPQAKVRPRGWDPRHQEGSRTIRQPAAGEGLHRSHQLEPRQA